MTSFLTSPSSILETGIPVHLETIRATSSSSTSSLSMRFGRTSFNCAVNFLSSSSVRSRPYRMRPRAQNHLCALQLVLHLELLDLFLERTGLGDQILFTLPVGFQCVGFFSARPVLSRLQPAVFRVSVAFLSACFSISELGGAPVDRSPWASNRSGCAEMRLPRQSGR